MNRTPYSTTLQRFCENALINLYIHVSDNEKINKITPLHTRNKILVSHIKERIGSPDLKPIKSEMKRLVKIPSGVSVESALKTLLDTVLPKAEKNKAEMTFIDMLAYVHSETGLMIDFEKKGASVLHSHLYLIKDEFFSCVDNTGHYNRPVSLKVFCNNPTDVMNLITKDNRFCFEIEEEGTGYAFLKLQPIA
jgi:hypothetical protein